jgi:hypothetical protein
VSLINRWPRAADALPSGTSKRTVGSMAPDRSTSVAVWHGTTEELLRLRVAVEHSCSCVAGMLGRVSEICSAHRMLVDQRLLDHLLFVYRTTEAFTQAEWEHDVTSAVDMAALGQHIASDEPSGDDQVSRVAGREAARRSGGD